MYVSIRRKDKDMENFSRMTMLIPFSEYQKKIEAKAGSGDSQILKGGAPRCVIGETYPDLYSQAMYIAVSYTHLFLISGNIFLQYKYKSFDSNVPSSLTLISLLNEILGFRESALSRK